jgi:hypothetical protein
MADTQKRRRTQHAEKVKPKAKTMAKRHGEMIEREATRRSLEPPDRMAEVLAVLEKISGKLDRVIEILEEEDLTESPRT